MLSGVYRFPQMESVVFGKPFAEALAQEVDRLDARAVFVLASGTLVARDRPRSTGFAKCSAIASPGSAPRSARIRRGPMSSRPPMRRARPAPTCSSRWAAARSPMRQRWSVCASAMMSPSPQQLDDYRARIAADGTIQRPAIKPPAVRMIAIPTTLSAGEFTASAPVAPTRPRHVKESFSHPLMMPAHGHPRPGCECPHA